MKSNLMCTDMKPEMQYQQYSYNTTALILAIRWMCI